MFKRNVERRVVVNGLKNHTPKVGSNRPNS